MAAKGSNPYTMGQLGMWLQGEPAHTLCAGGIPPLMPREAQLWASIARKRCEMGRRRCFHRLLRQKLCIRVSSDRKSISETLRSVSYHTGIRTRDPRISSPLTCPLDQPAAAREGVPPISGHYVPGWATPGRPCAFPLCSVVSRAGVSGRAPLCSGEVGAPSGAGRRGAVVTSARDLYVASRAGFSCSGSSWSLPSFLASCGDFIAPRTSS